MRGQPLILVWFRKKKKKKKAVQERVSPPVRVEVIGDVWGAAAGCSPPPGPKSLGTTESYQSPTGAIRAWNRSGRLFP